MNNEWQKQHLLIAPKTPSQAQLDDETKINELRFEFDRRHEHRAMGCFWVEMGPIGRQLQEALKEYKERYGQRCPESKP